LQSLFNIVMLYDFEESDIKKGTITKIIGIAQNHFIMYGKLKKRKREKKSKNEAICVLIDVWNMDR